MKEIKRILLATDFSEISHNAKDTAAMLKDKLGCTLDVVHVFEINSLELPAPYYFMPGVDQWMNTHLDDLRKKGRTALDEMVAELGVDTHGHYLEGKPREMIVAKAEELGIDLIVMGTHGHSGFNRVVMGSVAEQVMRHAPCAVLTVKGQEKA